MQINVRILYTSLMAVACIVISKAGDTVNPMNEESKLVSEAELNGSRSGAIDPDPARELFQRLFKRRRAEHLEAVKGLLRLDHFERQYKMVSMISEKIFGVIQNSRATLESSGYVPGSQFPEDANVRDALASILENTALISELILRLPELVKPLLSAHHDWEVLLHWSLGFSTETRLLDTASLKLLHLVAQELGLVEPEPNYVNPYYKKRDSNQGNNAEASMTHNKPKKIKKQVKKGPQLTRHTEL